MEDALFGYLREHWPGITIAGIAIYLAVRITMWALDWKHRLKSTETDCKKIGTHLSPKIDNMDSSITKLDTSLTRLEDSSTKLDSSLTRLDMSFTKLLMYLRTKDGEMDAEFIQAHSPLRLTPAGEMLFALLDGKKIIDELQPALFTEIDKLGATTALDVQTHARVVIAMCTDLPTFNDAKNYIYNNPTLKLTNDKNEPQEMQVTLNSMVSILSIYLRDKYLEAHKEIDPTTL